MSTAALLGSILSIAKIAPTKADGQTGTEHRRAQMGSNYLFQCCDYVKYYKIITNIFSCCCKNN